MQMLGHGNRAEMQKLEAVKPISQHTKLPKPTVMRPCQINLSMMTFHFDDVFTLMYLL